MRNEEILTEVDRRFADQKQLIEAKFTHLSAIIQNGFEAGEHERKEIIKRQDLTNGRVSRLERNLGFLRWVGENPRLAIPLLVFFFLGIYYTLQYVGFNFLINLL